MATETKIRVEQLNKVVIQADGAEDFSSEQSMGSNKLIDLASPSSDNDAATKKYVDDGVSGPIAIAFNDVTDVDLTSPSDQDFLIFDNISGKWKNRSMFSQVRDIFTLVLGDITNKYVELSSVPLFENQVSLFIVGSTQQIPGVDFIMHPVNTKRLTWGGYALDGLLEVDDVLIVTYFV